MSLMEPPKEAEEAIIDEFIREGPLSTLEPPAHAMPRAEESLARLESFLVARESKVSQTEPTVSFWSRLWGEWMVQTTWAGAAAMIAVVALPLLFMLSPGTPVRPSTLRKAPLLTHKGKQAVFDLLVAAPASTPLRHTTPTLAKTGQHLHPGDFVQLRYKLPLQKHVMVVSLNERGELFVYYPFKGTHSIRVESGEGTLPPQHAWELDDILGLERMFVVASDAPFSLKSLRKALFTSYRQHGKQLESLTDLSGPWWVKSLLLRKMARPASPRR
jgi:hypothetical protein